ncbi:MAG: phage major capsid protein [Calditrichaeota bacterium]|nr:phage major capsid protein [Calditrichota bacterium]
MKLLIAALFFAIIGLFVGVQYSPEAALVGGVIFSVTGILLSKFVIIPTGIFGDNILPTMTNMDANEKIHREKISELVSQMEEITDLADQEERDLTDEESESWDDLNKQANAERKKLERHLATRGHRDKLNEKAQQINPDGTVKEPEIKVIGKSNAEDKEALYYHTSQIIRVIMAPKSKMSSQVRDKIRQDAFEALIDGGHYKGFDFKNAVEAFSTLTDSDGGIFLPTTISNQIMEIEREYGAFPANSLRIPMSVGGGRQILPNLLGDITFHAVNQGSEANASRFTFSGIALEELKWMAFVPWTNEIGATVGERLVNMIVRKLGEASAGIKDDAAINGDGTSTYHNLKGLVERSGDANFPEVRLSTAITTHDSFAEIDEDDFINATLDVAPSIRNRGIFVLHPDWRVALRKIKDTEGRPLYLSGGAISYVDGVVSIFGHKVVFTEKCPNTDGVSKEYGIFYVPEYFAFGDVGAFSVEELTEATIKDVNGSDIRLASQDMRALRVKQFFDYELSQLTISSGGNDLGAFTVLRTAAS